MSPDETRKRTPPYISPLTFRQLLEDLARAPVARVDRSYLTTLHAGGTSGQIIAALHYMNLLEVSGKPGVKLDLLAKAKIQPDQADYKGYLREILENSYAFVLRGQLDLTRATYNQLEEFFTAHCGVDGDVRRKCIKFFITLAREAGIQLSPHVMQKTREVLRGPGSARTTARKPATRPVRPVEFPQHVATISQYAAIWDKLLDKFPAFDMEWSEETRQKWLDSFQQLMIRLYPVFPPDGSSQPPSAPRQLPPGWNPAP